MFQISLSVSWNFLYWLRIRRRSTRDQERSSSPNCSVSFFIWPFNLRSSYLERWPVWVNSDPGKSGRSQQLNSLKYEIYLVFWIWMNPRATCWSHRLLHIRPCLTLSRSRPVTSGERSQVPGVSALWRCYNLLWLGNTGWEIVNDRTGCEGGERGYS